jgi:2-(1,2-epoxy-1,2-dihydrophenyl)acetyl-CoA isomerase
MPDDATLSAQAVVTERRGGTLVVTLNRPDKLNAISALMVTQLVAAWDEANSDDVRAVLITGAGRGFCSGADLRPDPDVDSGPSSLRFSFNPMMLKLDALGKPVVAAVNGAAAGGGLGLACAADLRIASSTAKFLPAFINIGLVPDLGTSFRVPRIIGYERAFQWLLTGRPMSAEEALNVGLVQEVVSPENLIDRALALCEALTIGTPSAVRLTKRLLRDARSSTLAEQLDREDQFQAVAIADPGRAAARDQFSSTLGSPSR